MEGQEVDVSGECTAQYNLDHHGVHKRKRNCVRRRFRGRNENVFDLTREYDFKALYKLNNDALDEVESVERISGAVALKKDVGWMAKVKQKLTLKGKTKNCTIFSIFFILLTWMINWFSTASEEFDSI